MINHRLKYIGSLCIFGLLSTCCGSGEENKPASEITRLADLIIQREPIALKPIRVLSRSTAPYEETNQEAGNSYPGKENSGIVKSRQFPDVLWVENDSGDDPKIYPIRANGEDYRSSRYAGGLGITIANAINVDWEDITVDASGNVIVADVGNNRNDRRDLVFYVIPEPSPDAGRTTAIKRYFIRYPDQTSFPPEKAQMNFDCEAVFTVGDVIYCFSKNRGDKLTTLYRLDNPRSDEVTTLTKLQTLDLNGQVVGADATSDGKRLVVITYSDIWLFERDSTSESFFEGRISWAPYKADQVESVCFADDQTIFMIDEVTGLLQRASLSDLSRLKADSPIK